jgi:hypothetical protein
MKVLDMKAARVIMGLNRITSSKLMHQSERGGCNLSVRTVPLTVPLMQVAPPASAIVDIMQTGFMTLIHQSAEAILIAIHRPIHR